MTLPNKNKKTGKFHVTLSSGCTWANTVPWCRWALVFKRLNVGELDRLSATSRLKNIALRKLKKKTTQKCSEGNTGEKKRYPLPSEIQNINVTSNRMWLSQNHKSQAIMRFLPWSIWSRSPRLRQALDVSAHTFGIWTELSHLGSTPLLHWARLAAWQSLGPN